MIDVQLEPKNMQDVMPEHCAICRKATRYWHIESNTPVCIPCSRNIDYNKETGGVIENEPPEILIENPPIENISG